MNDGIALISDETRKISALLSDLRDVPEHDRALFLRRYGAQLRAAGEHLCQMAISLERADSPGGA